jgi:hypothetical protein
MAIGLGTLKRAAGGLAGAADPRSLYDKTLGRVGSGLRKGLFPNRSDNEFREVDPDGNLSGQAGASSKFADRSEGRFGRLGGEATTERDYMRRLARGEDSVSALQLKQALQQNQSAQASMAAGARPGQGAMAARTAMENSGRLGASLSGQQAVAGLQERQAAQNSLNQMLMQQRQQELQAALGGRGQALQGYGDIEQARSNRFNAMLGTPLPQEQFLGALMGAGGLMASDSRLKKDIKGGDRDADALLKALRAKSYRYKDERHGEGTQLGILAQDLQKTKIGRQAVIETDGGLMVHGAKLAGALAATLPGLDKRLAKIEGKGR